MSAFNASSSSMPSQTNSTSSPHFTHAPSTLSTLLALAVFSLHVNVINDLYCIASLQRIPAGRRCKPVGFFTVTFRLTIISNTSNSFYEKSHRQLYFQPNSNYTTTNALSQ